MQIVMKWKIMAMFLATAIMFQTAIPVFAKDGEKTMDNEQTITAPMTELTSATVTETEKTDYEKSVDLFMALPSVESITEENRLIFIPK